MKNNRCEREAIMSGIMKKLISALSAILMLAVVPAAVGAETSVVDDEYTAMDSFTGSVLGDVNDVIFSENRLSFEYFGMDFDFPMKEVSVNTSNGNNIDGARYYTGNSGSMTCNLVRFDGKYGFSVFEPGKSHIGRTNDRLHNFSVVNMNSADAGIHDVGSRIADETSPAAASPASINGGLSVYASGLNIPFLISAGTVQGWCTTTRREGNQMLVSGLSYVVSYNMPSDGVSLWYDARGNVKAWGTPAWPSSQYTSVNGTWLVNAGAGTFMAQATVSALVRGVPLVWEVLDVTDMYGNHRGAL